MKKALKRIGLILLLGVLVSLVGLYGFQEFYYRKILDPRFVGINSRLKTHLGEYLGDKRILASLDVFSNPSGQRDAGPFLNPIVEWTSEHEDLQKYKPSSTSPLVLPEALKEKLKSWNQNEFDHLQEFDFEKLDMTWMESIGAYDYWDVHHNSPVEKMYQAEVLTKQREPFSFAVSYPVPDPKNLIHWVRLRWMRAAKDGSFLSAAKETRHLARLAFSTETLVGGLLGTAILGTEVNAHKKALEMKMQVPSDWQPISIEVRVRLARFVMGTAAYFSPVADVETLKKALLEPPFLSVTCGSVMEGIQNHSVARLVLAKGLPLERNYREPYKQLDEVVNYYASKCRIPFAKMLWNNERAIAVVHALNRDPGWHKDAGTSPWLLNFPYLRTISGGVLLSVGTPDYLKKYDEPLRTEF